MAIETQLLMIRAYFLSRNSGFLYVTFGYLVEAF